MILLSAVTRNQALTLSPLAALLAFTVGCQGKPEVPLFPVQGQVTVEKVPLTSGIVGLHPDADHGNASKVIAWGTLDEKGTYSVFTEGRPGAPLGQYKVTVIVLTPPEDARAPLPNAIYKKATTTDQHFEVTELPAPGAYDLHLKH
jgi:hypothetical protein